MRIRGGNRENWRIEKKKIDRGELRNQRKMKKVHQSSNLKIRREKHSTYGCLTSRIMRDSYPPILFFLCCDCYCGKKDLDKILYSSIDIFLLFSWVFIYKLRRLLLLNPIVIIIESYYLIICDCLIICECIL